MEIRTLRYFLAVAREENMTKAAETLHVTQPTLSKALKSLEDELGKKLFTRHSFSIRLTEEGNLLRNHAEDLVSMADRIEKEFLSLDDITGGDLYFGLAESYQISFLAREIHEFKKMYPDLRYHITSGDTEQVAEKLDKGLLDFAVLAEIPDPAKYNIGLPLFCSGQGWEKDIPHWAMDKMDQLHLEGSFRLSYNASLFAKEHLGYLLTFDRLVDTSEASGLTFRPLTPRLETKLFLIWKRYQTFSPIAERFLRQIRASFIEA